MEAFHHAVERNDLHGVATMLGRDAEQARSRDDDGKSALHKAAGRGLVEMVRKLLQAGRAPRMPVKILPCMTLLRAVT